MDLIHKKHITRLQIGENRRNVARPLEHWAGGLAQIHAELGCNDVRKRGLAKAGRPEDQHMIKRLGALPRGAQEYFELRLYLRLTAVLRKAARPDGRLHRFFLLRCVNVEVSFY